MKLAEAKEIVSSIINWQFVLQGIKEREEISENINLQEYSLEDLIKANKLVTSNNNRKRKLAEYWRKKTGKQYSTTTQLVLADRLIAGVYTALNFTPNSEMVVLINDIGVGCVKADYK